MRVGLALPVALLMAANSWGATKSVSYIDEDGKEKTHDCTVLDTNTNISSLSSGGWYVVEGSLSYTSQLKSSGNLYFILADGASLNVSGSKTNLIEAANVTIYGQREQTGSMNLNQSGKKDGILSISFDPDGRAFYVSSLTVNGGIINATTSGTDAICATGKIVINDGTINAVTTGGNSYHGIKSGCSWAGTGNIEINWADTLYASSYNAHNGTMTILNGLTFKDNSGNSYSGSNPSNMGGKKLTPDYLVTFMTYSSNNTVVAKRAFINGEYTGTKTVNITTSTEADVIDFNRKFTAGIPSTVVLPFSLPSGTEINATFFSLDSVYQNGCKWRASMTHIEGLPAANTPYAVILTEGSKLWFDLKGEMASFHTEGDLTQIVSEGNWKFVGTYAFKEWNSGNEELGLAYGFAGTNENQITKGKFGKIALDATDPAKIPSANPLRAYLRKASSNVQLVCSTSNGHPAARGESATFAGIPETIDVDFIENGENGEHTTFVGRLNTRTGEFQMNRDYDLKGRKVNNAPKAHGAYYGKKVLKK